MTGRPPTLPDVPALVALLNRIADVDGAGWIDEPELRTWLTAPGLLPDRARVFEEDGGLVAYADVYVPAGAPDRAWLDVRVPADRCGTPLADEALDWAEAAAAATGARLLRVRAAATARLVPLLEGRRYRPVRHSFDMEIALDAHPTEPRWPSGIAVRPVDAGEEPLAHAAADESFEDHWEHSTTPLDEWLHHMTGDGYDPSLWFAAVAGDEIAGVCLCHERRVGCETLGWVSTLGVRRPWRRRGLGRALLLHAFRVFHERGYGRAGLSVDGENLTGAVRLYERAGMHVARRLDTFQLDVREQVTG